MINEYNEGTGYKRIFECAQVNGCTPLINLLEEIKNLSESKIFDHAILSGIHDTLSLVKTKEYKDTIKYLREWKKDLLGLSLDNYNILSSLYNLRRNPENITKYIENARKLEELKIEEIKLISREEIYDKLFACDIFREPYSTFHEIIGISKIYTDGRILYLTPERKASKFSSTSQITFEIGPNDLHSPTFLLRCTNKEKNNSYRRIEITDFGFSSEYLPTENELSSYEIPYTLKLTK